MPSSFFIAPAFINFADVVVGHNLDRQAAPGEPFAQFDGAPFDSASTEAYTVADMTAGTEFARTGGRPITLNVQIKNLTDKSYRDFLDTYKGYALSPGRDIRVTLRVPFGN